MLRLVELHLAQIQHAEAARSRVRVYAHVRSQPKEHAHRRTFISEGKGGGEKKVEGWNHPPT